MGGLGDPVNEAFEVLSNAHRRRILAALRDEDRLAFEELLRSAEGQRAAREAALVHTHLPKLADHGFVRWHREHGVVRRGPRFGELRPLLDLLDDRRDALPGDWH